MHLENISVRDSAAGGPANVSATVERWSGSLRNHIRQQGIQIAQQEIDVAHDVTGVHATADGWDIDAVLLVDDDDDDLTGELFTSDSWTWDGEAEVSYYRDAETDVQEEIRERVEEAAAPVIASETPFTEDMLDISSVRLRDELPDNIMFNL